MIRRTACLTALIAALAVVGEAQQYRLSDERHAEVHAAVRGSG
jgi:hypothetical protein